MTTAEVKKKRSVGVENEGKLFVVSKVSLFCSPLIFRQRHTTISR